MPHIGVHAISARQNKMNKRWVFPCGACWCAGSAADICAIYPALDIPFPAIASRCNPRHWRRYHISLCHITILGVWQARRCSAFLGVSRQYRWSEISTFTNLTITRRHCSQVSQRWQPHAVIHGYQQAQVAKPWGRRSHPITLKNIRRAKK